MSHLNKIFINWFIGFFEGDGSLVVNKRGYLAFIITQKEQNILLYIQNVFGFGSVIRQNLSTFRYIIQSKDNLRKIIEILNGNLISRAKQEQFRLFVKAYNLRYKTNIEILPNTNTISMNNAWFAGFTDAEGCFSVTFLKKKYVVRIRFTISQKDDKIMMENIRALFKKGRIEYHYPSNSFAYVLSGIKNLNCVFSYFNKYKLKTKKRHSYDKWKNLHFRLLQKDHLKAQKRRFLIKLANRINQE